MDIKELLSIVTLKKIDDNRFEGKNYDLFCLFLDYRFIIPTSKN